MKTNEIISQKFAKKSEGKSKYSPSNQESYFNQILREFSVVIVWILCKGLKINGILYGRENVEEYFF